MNISQGGEPLLPATTTLSPLKTHGFAFQPTSKPIVTPTTTSAPVTVASPPVTVEAPLESVAKSMPAKPAAATVVAPTVAPVATTPVSTTPAVTTSVAADGSEEKTAEDAVSVTKVKTIKKPKPEVTESTITVDEDESEERVIE